MGLLDSPKRRRDEGSTTSMPRRSGQSPVPRVKGPRRAPRGSVATTHPPDKRKLGPRILFLDIETAPLELEGWGLFDQNFGLEQIRSEWSIISFAAQWLDESKVHQFDVRGQRDLRDDRRLLGELWRYLDEADIVVAQNGKRFDVPKINARLLLAGFKPYSPIKVVDTLLAAKRHFAFTSNKLAWLSAHLAKKKKLEHRAYPGHLLWKACLAGDPKAWRVMASYNRRDIVSLREVYLALRPWIEGHPNVAAYTDGTKPACPKCGSFELARAGHAFTQTGKYQRYRCACGGFARDRYTSNSIATRRALLSN